MVFPKTLFALVLSFLFLNQSQSLAQTDSLINVNGLKFNINYLRRFTVQNTVRRVFANYGGSPNSGFTGDTAAIFEYDRGLRYGLDYDLPFSRTGILKNFSATFGLWYQSTKSEITYYATSKVNSNGSPREFGTFNSNSFSSLFALNYFYHKIRFTFGGNINLYQKNKFEVIYSDGLIDRGFESRPSNLSFLYSSFEFPILFKNKLLFRTIASFNRNSNLYAGFGLVYRVKSF